MNDMLQYMSLDPLWRKGSHNDLTFSMTYAYSENFILPAVARRGRARKMFSSSKDARQYDDKFNNLRVLYAYQMAHPGEEAQLHGNEFAQFIEWNFKQGLDWLLLDYEKHEPDAAFCQDTQPVLSGAPRACGRTTPTGAGMNGLSRRPGQLRHRLPPEGPEGTASWSRSAISARCCGGNYRWAFRKSAGISGAQHRRRGNLADTGLNPRSSAQRKRLRTAEAERPVPHPADERLLLSIHARQTPNETVTQEEETEMNFRKKRCVAMLLAGGQGKPPDGSDGEHGKACGSLRR